jgi:succinoglycan biosynthesis protein ExoA
MSKVQGANVEAARPSSRDARLVGARAAHLRRQHLETGEDRVFGLVPEPGPRRASVTTLTPVRNEERHIRETVAGLQAQDIAGDAEFIFIDGRSTDRTRAILSELAAEDERIRILDNPQGHTASALNIGLRAASGEYVARIDAHTRYPAHYLTAGIERLQRGDVDWVAGPQIPVGTDIWSRRVATALGTRLATGGSNRWERDVAVQRADEVELGTGVFTGVWRRVTLDRAGGWDEGWPINQDSELASRVLRNGGRIVSLPALGAEYSPRNSLPALGRQYHRYGMYRAKTTLRHPWTVRAPHVVLPGLVAAAIGAVVAPRRVRSTGRAIVALYGANVLVQSARSTTDMREAAALSLVFVTMHTSWGAGFLVGLVRFGLPSGRRAALAADLIERASEG